jgi:hypothetical protein
MWTLDEALITAKQFEELAAQHGYHVGLTGGTLYRGSSTKDLDLVVYPHSTERQLRRELMASLKGFGVSWDNDGIRHYNDDKLVATGQYNGKRIDFFFLS